MFMITLYGTPGSVYVRKVIVMLTEKGIPFENDPVSPMSKPLPAEYYAISPLGKIPALKEDDFCISDSSVICAYLEKKYSSEPKFYPEDAEQYAKVLWFEGWADTRLFSALAPFYYQTVLVPKYYKRDPDYQKVDLAKENVPEVNAYLEKSLGDNQYLVGNQFTLADLSVASVYFNMVMSGFPVDHERCPKLSAYLERIFSRPSFKSLK